MSTKTSEELYSALKNLLKAGPVSFAYRKKTGELRIAKGTTNLSLIPEESHPNGNGSTKANTHAYWDLNVEGWRAFNPLCVVWVFDEGMTDLTKDEAAQVAKYLLDERDRINAEIAELSMPEKA